MDMRKATQRDVGKALDVVTCGPGLRVPVAGKALDYLKSDGTGLFLKVQKEILLALEPSTQSRPAVIRGTRLTVPADAAEKLDLSPGDKVALVPRHKAVALKKVAASVWAAVASSAADTIPQVVAIAAVSRDGRLVLKKEVQHYLALRGNECFLVRDGETWLARGKRRGARKLTLQAGRLVLPRDVATDLGVGDGGHVAMIQRPESVAVKAMTLTVKQGVRASAVDVETPLAVDRILTTNGTLDEIVADAQRAFRKARLEHSVLGYLEGKRTLECWQARRALGTPDPGDDRLRRELIEHRVATQQRNGSWEDDTTLTSRHLTELSELGATRRMAALKKGAAWLLGRRESRACPGLFLLSDEIVAQQERIAQLRSQGKKAPELRTRNRNEMRHVARGNPLYRMACAPRTMWPNAFAMGALVNLGYETHARVQRGLEMLLRGGWCGCGVPGAETLDREVTLADLDRRVQTWAGRFRYGRLKDPADLLKMDLTRKSGIRMPRVSRDACDGGERFVLRLPDDIGPCALVTAQGLYRAKGRRIRTRIVSSLWNFACQQNVPDGAVSHTRNAGYFGSTYQPAVLDTFARYDDPVCEAAIMKALPWIHHQQQPDGSWGGEGDRDADTGAVVRALAKVRHLLPAGFVH